MTCYDSCLGTPPIRRGGDARRAALEYLLYYLVSEEFQSKNNKMFLDFWRKKKSI